MLKLLSIILLTVAVSALASVQPFYNDVTFKEAVKLEQAASNSAAVFNASKSLVASSVSASELGYLSGVTSALQGQINAKQDSLAAGYGITIAGSTISTVLDGTYAATVHYHDTADITSGSWSASDIYLGNVSDSEFEFLNGVTSGIQTQIDAKFTSPLTTTGDIIYSSSGTAAARLGIGSNNDVLTVSSGVPTWLPPTGGSGSSVDDTQLYTYNLIKNAGFESGDTSNWSVSLANSLTVQSSTVAAGTYSGTYSPSTAGNYLVSDSITVPEGLKGRQAGLAFYVKGCSASVSAQVIDQASNVLITQVLQGYTDWQQVQIPFIMPITATSVTVKFLTTTASAANCYFDRLFLDDAYRMGMLGNISQAEYVGSSYIEGTASCTWNITSSSLAAPTAVGSCSGPIIVDQKLGTWLTTDTDLPKQTINNIPAGTYRVVATVAGIMSGGNSLAGFAINDGIDNKGYTVGYVTTGVALPFTIEGVFTYTSSGNRTFSIVGLASANTIQIQNVAGYRVNFYVYKFPTSTQVAQTPEYVNRVVGVKWQDVTSCSFTSTGGAMADSDCTSASATVIGNGVTAGSGTFSMTVTNIPPGKYRIAADGVFRADYATATTICQFRLLDGSSSIAASTAYASAGTITHYISGISGIVEYTSFQPTRTFTINATRSSGSGTCDCLANTAGYGCSLNLIPLDQGLPLPNILNSVATPASGGVKVASAYITNSGTPVITRQDGSWISTAIKTGTGAASLNIEAGTFSIAPNCVCTPTGAGTDNRKCNISSAPTTTLVTTLTEQCTTGTDSDVSFSIICVGAK